MASKFFLTARLLMFLLIFSAYRVSNKEQFSAKAVLQNMAKVNDSLYVCKYEVSNVEYRNFLNNMRQQSPDLADKYKIDSTGWLFEPGYREPMAVHYHLHPAFNNYPVVNISYEGAVAYGNWLTEQYNADPKRKIKKVKFILPTEEEWIKAAQGGKGKIRYPWGYNSLRRKTGEYVCNFTHFGDVYVVKDSIGKPVFNFADEKEFPDTLFGDRSFYTADVKSFWPNAIGVYNLSGNAAEMTIHKGLTKGGSWNSYGGEVTIQSKKIYEHPSPEVGFRVFMKKIER